MVSPFAGACGALKTLSQGISVCAVDWVEGPGENNFCGAKKKGLTEIALTFTVSIPQLSLPEVGRPH
jgi:hypothetical protein